MILALIILGIVFVAFIYFIYHSIIQSILFKSDGNPFRRYCKRCGACQMMFQSNIEGNEHNTWWEEVYPIGNNPKCKCHKYTEYHN